MQSLEELRQAFHSEVGAEVSELVRNEELDRWIQRGQARLDFYKEKEAAFTWDVGDTGFDLPTDFHHPEEFRADDSFRVPEGSVWGSRYRFRAPATSAGSGILLYHAYFPAITRSADSELPEIGDDAILSYALYRFYKRMASSRADYRRYATLTQNNGVDISELDALSERHFADYEDARAALRDLRQNASSFYSDF